MKYFLVLSLILTSFFKSSSQEVSKEALENSKKNCTQIMFDIFSGGTITIFQFKGIKKVHTTVDGEKIKSYTEIFSGTGFEKNQELFLVKEKEFLKKQRNYYQK
jgi:hypothetical protein